MKKTRSHETRNAGSFPLSVMTSHVDFPTADEAKVKIEEMRNFIVGVEARLARIETFVNNVEGRFAQIEASFPERFHNIESRQTQFVATINALTGSLSEKFKEIEDAREDKRDEGQEQDHQMNQQVGVA